ncbi:MULTISPECIES: 3TM-type holin [unclassified Pseudoalteromonas]|uniref:3TM-type holin n=1 Tax=unclassified Pseudoalteromonas TaxID=194690 RepID=UPI001B39D286|nr:MULTISPECIES: 3TM-type holin [unclassified Pseudoalteromonas]MBQ4845289.1 hypothetical protein [Pseudoalteromonas sp. MMG005]MBQ4852419.1 hypothetical protein [Pseudoalteromonas sp. MMG012]
MGFLSTLFSTNTQAPMVAIGTLLDELFTSDEEALNLAILKQRVAQQPNLVQNTVNQVQASHRSLFVAGARPFLMWVCGLGFLFAFVINPILQWIWPGIGTPNLPLDAMLELTLAMLGLAGLRTVEKLKGVAK